MLEWEWLVSDGAIKKKFELSPHEFPSLWDNLLESEVISCQPGIVNLQNSIGVAGGRSDDLETRSVTF